MPTFPNKRRGVPRVQKLIKKRASNSKSMSTPRVAVRRNATRKRPVAKTSSRPLQRRLPGSFQGLAVSQWSHNVENPFSESASKIPDLISGPPSCLMSTVDLTNTYSKVAWSAGGEAQTSVVEDMIGNSGGTTINFTQSIDTVGQQLIVQFLPCVMSPASFLLTPEESSSHYPIALAMFLTKALEHSADQITPILGYWLVLDVNGKIIGVELLRADKLMTAEESIKLIRLTKAGIRVGLQQPKFTTGGQVYMNRGAGAFLPIFGVPDLNGNSVDGSGYRETLSAFKPGYNCYVNLDEAGSAKGPGGFSGDLATKANMVRLCSKTAGTSMKSLDAGPHSMSMASYPLDSVKALEYMAYDKADTWGVTGMSLTWESIVGADNGTLGRTAGWPETEPLLSDAVGYNSDRIMTRWCPGWFVFHPTFSTSINPAQIVANLQIETFTAWEFIPYARTFAHLTRTPSHSAPDASYRKVGNLKDSLSGTGGINKSQTAPLQKGAGRFKTVGEIRGGTR